MNEITIALTEPQEEFAFSEAQFPAMIAGLGAGKSRASTIRLLLLMIENMEHTGKGINTLYTMPTYDLLRLRAMPGIEEDLTSLGLEFKVNKSEYSIFVPEGIEGRVAYKGSVHNIIHQLIGVITSYSIHYTKLYEILEEL